MTTLYLPTPISTTIPNLWSDRRKPYAILRQRSVIRYRAFSCFGYKPKRKMRKHFSGPQSFALLKEDWWHLPPTNKVQKV